MQNYKKFIKLWKSVNPLWVYMLFCLLCLSCKDSDSESEFNPNAPVEVNQIVPETGKMSLPLVIHGKNFGTDKSKIKVLFDDVQAVIISAKNEHLYVLNPRQHGGEHTVKVVVEDKEGVLATKFNYIAVATVSTVAGSGEEGFDDGELMKAKFAYPAYLSADDKNNIVVTDANQKVRLVSLEENKVTTLLNNGSRLYSSCFSPDFSHMYVAREVKTQLGYDFDCNFNWESSSIDGGDFEVAAIAVVTDELGNIYFIGNGGEIVKKNFQTNKFTKIGTIPSSLFNWDFYATYNPTDGMIYLSIKNKFQIIRVNVRKSGVAEEDVELSTDDYELYAGAGENYDYKDGYRLEAEFILPMGIGVDSEGNLYVADNGNGAIRKIDTEGMVTTLAGGPDKYGYKDGPLEDARFTTPCGLAVDAEDIIYVSEYNDFGGTNNPRIRRIAIQ